MNVMPRVKIAGSVVSGVFAALTAFVLVSCGGGGGGTSSPPPPPPPAPQSQTIAFAAVGPLTKVVSDAPFSNIASGGAGTGAIRYSSADATIATVNASSGEVTLVAPGTVQITADKAGDSAYLAATATYSLVITAAPPIAFTAWIGAQDTLVQFPVAAQGLSLLHSTQADCMPLQIQNCTNGSSSAIAAAAVADGTLTLSREAWYWLQRANAVSSAVHVAPTHFVNRSAAAATSFQGKLWLVGGQGGDIALRNDVWSSTDGVSWDLVTMSAGFPVRGQHRLLAFNNRLWVIGGNGSGPYQNDVFRNDVWSSADGITWREDAHAAAFPGRIGNAAVVFNNRMWVIGGYSPSGTSGADVWSSSDGVTWTQATADGGFASASPQAVVFNGRMWLILRSAQGTMDAVWSSADGVSWALATASAFPARISSCVAVLNNRIWLFGGVDYGTYLNDAWSSADGVTWTQSTQGLLPTGRWAEASTVHAGRVWVIGGEFAPAQVLPSGGLQLAFSDDVWSSADGANWVNASPLSPLYEGGFTPTVLNGKLWAIAPGGSLAPTPVAWNSTDGVNWSAPTIGLGFPGRSDTELLAFNNRIWLIGGQSNATKLNDVWSTADGTSWTVATSSAQFPARIHHRVVAFNNQLYLVGGETASGFANDVWTSSDGITWAQITAAAQFSARSQFGLAVANGKLWLIGGTDATGVLSDAWSSTDGIQWQLVNAAVPTLPVIGFRLIAHNGLLWLTGGLDVMTGSFKNEIWSSADAVSWTQVSAAAAYSPRFAQGMASFNGSLFVFGGGDALGSRGDVWTSTDGVDWRLGYVGAISFP